MTEATVVFSGHRIDATDRGVPRFPAARAPEIGRILAGALPNSATFGVSSASNGGDILFLEACEAKGIPYHITLPFPPDEFRHRSVATDAPGEWEARFTRLWLATPLDRRHVISTQNLPNPYAACNEALLCLAEELGEPQLIALWDGQEGDGLGGTADMVTKTRALGWPVKVISP